MRRVFAVITVLGALALAKPAGAITNGAKVVQAPTWIAYVTTTSKILILQTTETSCTGQVVSPSWVLTAAHCVVKEDSNGSLSSSTLKPLKFSIVLGRIQLSQSLLDGGQFKVDRVQVFPGWNPRCICGDAALLHLTRSVDGVATAVPIAQDIPSGQDAGKTFAYGYGFIRETWSRDSVRKNQISNYRGENANFLYRTKTPSYQIDRSCTTKWDVCLHRSGRSIIRNGDSGGPWVNPSQGPSVFALTSYSMYRVHNDQFEFPRVFATRITNPRIRNWIVSTAEIFPFARNTIYQAGSKTLAWFNPDTGPALPIRKQSVLTCLRRTYPVVNVSNVVLTELLRNPEGPSASCG